MITYMSFKGLIYPKDSRVFDPFFPDQPDKMSNFPTGDSLYMTLKNCCYTVISMSFLSRIRIPTITDNCNTNSMSAKIMEFYKKRQNLGKLS